MVASLAGQVQGCVRSARVSAAAAPPPPAAAVALPCLRVERVLWHLRLQLQQLKVLLVWHLLARIQAWSHQGQLAR